MEKAILVPILFFDLSAKALCQHGVRPLLCVLVLPSTTPMNPSQLILEVRSSKLGTGGQSGINAMVIAIIRGRSSGLMLTAGIGHTVLPDDVPSEPRSNNQAHALQCLGLVTTIEVPHCQHGSGYRVVPPSRRLLFCLIDNPLEPPQPATRSVRERSFLLRRGLRPSSVLTLVISLITSPRHEHSRRFRSSEQNTILSIRLQEPGRVQSARPRAPAHGILRHALRIPVLIPFLRR